LTAPGRVSRRPVGLAGGGGVLTGW